MKITAKPLKGDTFDVEIDPEQKVSDLKAKIAEARPEFPADSSKLIYSGKILVDTQQIKEYNIKDGEFVVVMVAKAKAAAPAAEPAAAPAQPAAPDAPAAAPTQPTGPVSYEQAASNLVSGGNMEGTITQLMEMGFDRPQVEKCLRAAFNNPDRAVEYLMSGIPANLEQAAEGGAAPPAAGAAPPAAGDTPAAAPPAAGGPTPFPAMPAGGGASPFPAMPTGGGGGDAGAPTATDGPLAELRNHPRLPELAAMCAQNPAMLQQILPAIAQQNPGLVQAIQENPEEFMRILQEAARGEGGGVDAAQDPVSAMLAAVQGGGGGGGGGGGPRPQRIQLSEQDRAAVERLAALGFDPQMAAQAYLACEKNEEMAANFLFDDSMND